MKIQRKDPNKFEKLYENHRCVGRVLGTKVRKFDLCFIREIPLPVIRGAILTDKNGSFSCSARTRFSSRNDENYFEFKDHGPLPSTGHRRDKLSTKVVEHRCSTKKKRKEKGGGEKRDETREKRNLKFLDHRHDLIEESILSLTNN